MCLIAAGLLVVLGFVLLIYGGINATFRTKRIQLAQPSVPSSPADPNYAAFMASPTVGFQMAEPTSTSFYVFNVTNTAAVLQGALPTVQQLGPYVYTQSSEKVGVAWTSNPSTVSYRVHTSYAFDATRSNGSESDVVTTVNASYARALAKLSDAGFSEQLLAASFAHTQLASDQAYLRGPFLAQTKQRALGPYLRTMDQAVRRAALPAALTSFQARVAAQSLPQNVERLLSYTRQARIPGMLSALYDSFLVQYIPTTLAAHYTSLRQLSVPRVLGNTLNRLQVEATPTISQSRELQLRQQAVPVVLQTMLPRILSGIALPHVVRDYMEAACFEAVPSMLNTIKNELVAVARAAGSAADVAQQSTLLQWMATAGPWTNVDALVGGAPTTTARYGFELNSIPVTSSTSSRAVSVDVAALLFGAKVNIEFSLLAYDPSDNTRGFGLWKRAVNGDASAVARLLVGVNAEVALPANFLTTAQVQGVCEYILYWSRSTIMHRDRQRYWATAYTQRTTNSNTEPGVALDWNNPSVQTGFPLASTNLGMTELSLAKLWDVSVAPSFLSAQGYITWTLAMANNAAAQTTVQTTFGLTPTQMTGVLAWLTAQVTSATLKRQVLRGWSRGGRVASPFNNVTSIEYYDLEPNVAGSQTGFELDSNNLVWPDGLLSVLWDRTQAVSFTNSAGIAQWNNILVAPTGLAAMTSTLNALNVGTVTEDHVRQISAWLQSWPSNVLTQQAIHQWWRNPTAYPLLTLTSSVTPFVLNRPTLSAAAAEALWNAANGISFLNLAGYALWMTASTPVATLQTALNAQVTLACSQLLGDANSALFATPMAGSCVPVTLTDVAAIQTYVQQLNTDPYVKTALLQEWQCGTSTAWDVEPYRPGLQTGWELCQNATCGLSQSNNTVCVVPAAALVVWDPNSAVSLLNPTTYQTMWLPLQTSSTTMAATQMALATAFGQAQWLPWMDVIASWVVTWVGVDTLVRDVLGLWFLASCPTGTLLSQSQSSSTATVNSCSAGISSTSNETAYTSALVGGRSTTYFTATYALQSAANVGPMVIQSSQSVASCNGNVQTTATTTSVYATSTCLMMDIDTSVAGVQRGFELNTPTSTLTIDVVQSLWDATKPYSFLNPAALNTYWSMTDVTPAKLVALWQLVTMDAPALSLTDLAAVVQWLKAWQHNQLMSLFVLQGWLAPTNATIPTFVLNPQSTTPYTGFELRSVMTAASVSSYPTMSQAQYLWNSANTYSFLTSGTDTANVGFGAWVQAYSGPIPGSEQLTAVYPPMPQVVRVTQVANATIVANIQAATGLSAAQVQAVATWLLSWADHPFLWNDVMSQWLTQMTQFTDTPSVWNLASIDTTTGVTLLTGFELPTSGRPAAFSISTAQATMLWNVYTPYSILNPKILIVWCFVLPSVGQNCPHLVDAAGAVTPAAVQSLTTTLTAYQTMVFPGSTFTGTQPMDRARSFLTVTSGLSLASIMTVATWFFALPSSSVYQYLMIARWLQGSLPLDSTLAGYELATIYDPTQTVIPRNTTAANLVANTVCPPMSTASALRLWLATDVVSFTNANSLWVNNPTTLPATITTLLTPCQVTQVQQWLQSWQWHPYLRQLVEYAWFATCTASTPCTSTTPSLYGSRRGFEIVLGATVNMTVWPQVAQLVWDTQSPLSFLHPNGIQLWKTLLLAPCASSNANGTCAAAASTATPPATAFAYLSTALLAALGNTANVGDIQSAVFTIGQKWLLADLDNTDFSTFLLVQVLGSSSISSLATQQWINASVLSVNYTSMGDTGAASQKDIVSVATWNASSQQVTMMPAPPLAGFPEFRAFCDRAAAVQVYDVAPQCALGVSYVINDATASSTWALLTDSASATINNLTMARGVLRLYTYMSQPFAQRATCLAQASLVLNNSQATSTVVTPACVAIAQGPSSTVYVINNPTVLPAATSLAQLRDMQQYLMYLAAKFGYERQATLPLGSYLTPQTVHDVLWRNTATDATNPTAALPLSNIQFGVGNPLTAPFVANVTANQSNVVASLGLGAKFGCVIALVGSGGTDVQYQDPTCGYTDGSVFAPGTPSSIAFFWTFGRQVLTLTYAAATTRFGVPLRRYMWPSSWLSTAAAIYDDLPTIVTSPHLYNLTSPALPFAQGLVADPTLHASIIDVEPITGLVLHSRFNWQVNVQVGSVATVWSPNVTAAYLPVFWVRQERSVSGANSFDTLSDPGPFAAEKVAVWEIVWGVLLIVAGAVFLRRMYLAQQRMVRLIQPDKDGNSSNKNAIQVDALVDATEPDAKSD
ncbi:Aste57867_21265 [Aphanomyces stellatus]|uniref:Aste57867_21265 protein n=1 Tax=Aphanomyces stellatus TaxID=120398 RepID=A0A485LIH3_9STRA|nr:hypothetical protein As57867_021196 [Aphanomyces stellatus]VFT97937.1 Aste57867_21265 [Aphanomyces stellatus]